MEEFSLSIYPVHSARIPLQVEKFLVINQLEAQFFFLICLFIFFTCFEQPCAHHQECQLYQYDIWYMSLCTGDCLVCRLALYRVTYTRCTPDDEHMAA